MENPTPSLYCTDIISILNYKDSITIIFNSNKILYGPFITIFISLLSFKNMNINLSFNINAQLYKKNPEDSTIGKDIVRSSIELICEIGIEAFTFKKLAAKIQHTEATIYRYFESKQMLLLYIVNWYWCYLDFLIEFRTQNITHPKKKIEELITILSHSLNTLPHSSNYDLESLYYIVIREGAKVYMHIEVKSINKIQLYKPYKDLCAKISSLFIAYNPKYKFHHSLASTLVETSHSQIFFVENLPRLTDVNNTKNKDQYIYNYLSDLIFKSLN